MVSIGTILNKNSRGMRQWSETAVVLNSRETTRDRETTREYFVEYHWNTGKRKTEWIREKVLLEYYEPEEDGGFD